jgi:hypothetical protein
MLARVHRSARRTTMARRSEMLVAGLWMLGGLFGCSSGDPLGARDITVTLDSKADDFDHPESEKGKGRATIDTRTGDVFIVVENMPQLVGEQFEGWLAGGDESPVSTGLIPIDDDGMGHSSALLGSLTESTYDRVVLTVEPDPDDDPEPAGIHSLSGDIP